MFADAMCRRVSASIFWFTLPCILGAPFFPDFGKGGCFDFAVAGDVLFALAFVPVAPAIVHPSRPGVPRLGRALPLSKAVKAPSVLCGSGQQIRPRWA